MSLDVKKDRGPSNLTVVVIYQSEISHTFSRRRATQGGTTVPPFFMP